MTRCSSTAILVSAGNHALLVVAGRLIIGIDDGVGGDAVGVMGLSPGVDGVDVGVGVEEEREHLHKPVSVDDGSDRSRW